MPIDWFELFWIIVAGIGWALAVALYERLRITQDKLDAMIHYAWFRKTIDKMADKEQ